MNTNSTPIVSEAARRSQGSAPWGVIYYPKEGTSQSHKRWKKIRRYMQESGIQFDYVQSEELGSVERLAAMMSANGYQTILVVGGDAALYEALNGIMHSSPPSGKLPALGVIPSGFGNDFAHYWGFEEKDYRQTIDRLALRKTRRVDVGVCRMNHGEMPSRYFLNCVNIGAVASIINIRRKTRRFWGMETLSYLTSAFLLLFQRMSFKLEFTTGGEHFRRQAMTACIGSAHGYGQTPSAVPYNGLLDVSVVSPPQLTQLLHGLWLLFAGRFLSHKGISVWRTGHIEFLSTGSGRVSLDGRMLHQPVEHLDISILPEKIEFLIP